MKARRVDQLFSYVLKAKHFKDLGYIQLEEWQSVRIENFRMMKKQENRKDFNFLHFCLVRSEKSGRMENMSLYKVTHILLLKNDAQLKPKKKKKSNHLNLLKNKNHVQEKKSHLNKNKNTNTKESKRKKIYMSNVHQMPAQ